MTPGICGCSTHAERDATVRAVQRQRHEEFEQFMADRPTPRLPRLPVDHETTTMLLPPTGPPLLTGRCWLTRCFGKPAHGAHPMYENHG